MRIRARRDGCRERRQAQAEAGSAGREPEPARGVRELAEIFRRQAEHFEALGSPVYARLARRLADDPGPVRPIVRDDHRWDVPLRLFAAVHYLVLTGAAPDALSGRFEDFATALREHEETLRTRLETHGVQTNEVQRCTSILPTLLAASAETHLPLELVELGPSAGLNLAVDRYRYRYANGTFGPTDALLELTVDEHGGRVPAALLERELVVRRRRGIDLAPIDATTPDGYLLLRSFLWPGLDDRVARLDAAVETLRRMRDRPELIEGDYTRVLPAVLADRPADALTVVFETFSVVYLPEEAARELSEALETAAADGRPLAWVSVRRWDMSAGGDAVFELELRIWPGPARVVAHVDPHGNGLDWILSRKAESAEADSAAGDPPPAAGVHL